MVSENGSLNSGCNLVGRVRSLLAEGEEALLSRERQRRFEAVARRLQESRANLETLRERLSCFREEFGDLVAVTESDHLRDALERVQLGDRDEVATAETGTSPNGRGQNREVLS